MLSKLDRALLLALFIPIFALLPFIQNAGLPFLPDALIHLLRQHQFERALLAGQIVPRWAPDLYLGYGSPIFVFAPPLFAYLSELPRLFGLGLSDALKISLFISFELYSIGMFLFMRPRVGAHGALLAATLYTYAPLRFREALISGGNYPQLLAFALFPWVLWSFERLIHLTAQPNHHTGRLMRATFSAALPLSALILSHNFHLITFLPILVAYIGFALASQFAKTRDLARHATRNTLQVSHRTPHTLHFTFHASRFAFLSILLTLALTTCFWLPLIAEQSLVRVSGAEFARLSDYRQRFPDWERLLAWPAPLDRNEANADVPLALGWPQMMFGGMGVLLALWRRKQRFFALFFVLLFCGATYLMLPTSVWLYERITFLQLSEFPWRFLGLADFALAALGGLVLPAERGASRPYWLSVGLLIAITPSLFYITPVRPFAVVSQLRLADVPELERGLGAFGTTTLNEYLPRTVPQFVADDAPLDGPRLHTRRLPPDATFQLIRRDALSEAYRIESASAFDARFRVFAYPGWRVRIDGNEAPLLPDEAGLVRAHIPTGTHEVQLVCAETPLRNLANGVSLVAAASMLIALWLTRRRSSSISESSLAVSSTTSEPFSSLIPLSTLLALLSLKLALLDPFGALQTATNDQPQSIFGEQIALLRWESTMGMASRGSHWNVRFYWRAVQAPSQNYHVFVQLLNPDGRAVVGSDKQHPGDPIVQGETPTASLPLDKHIRDIHRLIIPHDIPAGPYELIVGWYDPTTQQRLKLPDGRTTLTVGHITIE